MLDDAAEKKRTTDRGRVRTGEEEGYLPFLTVSFVALLQGRAPPLMLALQLGDASRVLLDQLAGLAVVFANQLLHLLVLLPLLSDESLLLLQLLQRLTLQFWRPQNHVHPSVA